MEQVPSKFFRQYVEALYSFMSEIHEKRNQCLKHNKTTAVHTKGESLQVYRLYKNDADAITYMRTTVASLPSWNKAHFWEGKGNGWEKVKRDITARMRRHKKLRPILTHGISWNGSPILVHAYKFEPDPIIKMELVMLGDSASDPDLSLNTILDALDCHEALIPEYVAKPLPPYERHETEFSTLFEYLSQTMPPDMYNLFCFPQQRDGV